MEIVSMQNNLIKQLKKQKEDLLFLDSPKLILEALKAKLKAKYFLVQKGKNFDFVDDSKTIIVSENILRNFSDMLTPQGCIGIFEKINYTFKPPSSNFLVLENIQDAGNVGTLIRSALGADFLEIYLIGGARLNNIKTVRSSMGSVFNINVYETNFEEFSQALKSSKLPLYTASMNGENIFNIKIVSPCGIVIGNEGNGISKQMQNICTKCISLPMNKKLESLNAGVSGSIIMYEIAYGGKNVRS